MFWESIPQTPLVASALPYCKPLKLGGAWVRGLCPCCALALAALWLRHCTRDHCTSPDDAAGLVICIAHGARVMLTSNLWTEFVMVNGAMATVIAICYKSGQAPPNLPVSVMVQFNFYSGPTLHDGTVPNDPIHHTWFASNARCSHLQLQLKLARAVTIHKAQGLTLDKVVMLERVCLWAEIVACSRIQKLTDLLFNPSLSFPANQFQSA